MTRLYFFFLQKSFWSSRFFLLTGVVFGLNSYQFWPRWYVRSDRWSQGQRVCSERGIVPSETKCGGKVETKLHRRCRSEFSSPVNTDRSQALGAPRTLTLQVTSESTADITYCSEKFLFAEVSWWCSSPMRRCCQWRLVCFPWSQSGSSPVLWRVLLWQHHQCGSIASLFPCFPHYSRVAHDVPAVFTMRICAARLDWRYFDDAPVVSSDHQCSSNGGNDVSMIHVLLVIHLLSPIWVQCR